MNFTTRSLADTSAQMNRSPNQSVTATGSNPARQRLQASARVSSKVISAHGTTRSCLDQLHQHSSARIRFPNTQGKALEAVLLNTAGGLTGDDVIQWQANAGKDSHLRISTAASEKIYRTHGPSATQQTRLSVAGNARLDWLPQETIVFDGAALHRTLDVELASNARALVVESLVFGRQAMNETCTSIHIHDKWRIHRSGTLLHAEEFRLDTGTYTAMKPLNETTSDAVKQPGIQATSANGNFAQQQGILHHYRAISTLLMISDERREQLMLQAKRIRALNSIDDTHISAAASVMTNRIVVRVLASNSFELRKFLIPCIELLSDGNAIPPVWNV